MRVPGRHGAAGNQPHRERHVEETMTRTERLTRSISLRTTAALIGALAVAAPFPTAAQSYPSKPIEMTVLFGGSAKTIADLLADGMKKRLGVAVPTVSRTGAGGAVGYSYVVKTKPDGYSIVWNSNSISTSHYAGNMPFSYRDFDAVARVSLEVPAMAVRADSGWMTFNDFVAAAKKRPGELKVGISGKGSFTHLASAALFDKAGIKVRYIPYGRGRAQVELLGGRIDAALQWPSQFLPHVQAGKLRMLLVTSATRVPTVADVPTAKELGYDVDITMWRGIAVPKGTPKAVIARLETAIRETVESPEFKQAGQRLGFQPAFLGAADFAKLIARDDRAIGALMKDLGIAKGAKK